MGQQQAARRGLAVAGVALGFVLGLTACSGGGGSAGDMAAGGGGAEPASGLVDRDDTGVDVRGESSTGAAARDGSAGVANRPSVSTRAVIRRGEISIVTKEMNRARLRVDDLLGRHGGYLASEDTHNDVHGRPERSVLVLRVPEPTFDTVMTDLARIGRTRQADRSSEDVTSQVVDVDARVATQEASLARLRGFLRDAGTVEDMIRLESEIAERQADLESLKAQQKYLRDNTAMSTVTVRLHTPAAPPPPPETRETGFLAGLAGGWAALRTVLVGFATAAGALLPFVAVVAVLGVPVWLLVRAVRRRRTPVTPPAADAG